MNQTTCKRKILFGLTVPEGWIHFGREAWQQVIGSDLQIASSKQKEPTVDVGLHSQSPPQGHAPSRKVTPPKVPQAVSPTLGQVFKYLNQWDTFKPPQCSFCVECFMLLFALLF